MSSLPLKLLSFNAASLNDGPSFLAGDFAGEGPSVFQPSGAEAPWTFEPLLVNVHDLRAARICKEILKEKPDVVLLQESVVLAEEESSSTTLPPLELEQEQKQKKKHCELDSLFENPNCRFGGPRDGAFEDQLATKAAQAVAARARQKHDASSLAEYIPVLRGYRKAKVSSQSHAGEMSIFVRNGLYDASNDATNSSWTVLDDTRCTGGENGGSTYNFPIVVLQHALSKTLLAIACVHLAPFGGNANARFMQLSRCRQAFEQIRAELMGTTSAHRALSSSSSVSSSDHPTRSALTTAFVPTWAAASNQPTESNAATRFCALVAGDTNMRENETTETIQMLGFRDLGVAPFPPPAVVRPQQPPRNLLTDDLDIDNTNAPPSPAPITKLFTFNTMRNKYNRDKNAGRFEALSGAPPPARGIQAAARAGGECGAFSMKLIGANKPNSNGYHARYTRFLFMDFNTTETNDNKEQQAAPYDESSSPAPAPRNLLVDLPPQSERKIFNTVGPHAATLRLFGDKPLCSRELDQIDDYIASSFVPERKRFGEDDDDDDNADQSQEQQELTNKLYMLKADKIAPLMLQTPLTTETSDASPPAPDSAYPRYLSDHFGLTCELVI